MGIDCFFTNSTGKLPQLAFVYNLINMTFFCGTQPWQKGLTYQNSSLPVFTSTLRLKHSISKTKFAIELKWVFLQIYQFSVGKSYNNTYYQGMNAYMILLSLCINHVKLYHVYLTPEPHKLRVKKVMVDSLEKFQSSFINVPFIIQCLKCLGGKELNDCGGFSSRDMLNPSQADMSNSIVRNEL